MHKIQAPQRFQRGVAVWKAGAAIQLPAVAAGKNRRVKYFFGWFPVGNKTQPVDKWLYSG